MQISNKELAKYMLVIKKITNYKVVDKSIVDDISQEVLIKLLKQDFFSNNKLDTEEEQKSTCAYIKRTVHSCYMDYLTANGISRRLTKSEKAISGNSYQNINYDHIDDVSDSELNLVEAETPEQQLFAKEAYEWIKGCYTALSEKIKDTKRRAFFEAAFWRVESYGLPLKALASQLGYVSSNPTQELNRFVEKVSMCTQPHGVFVQNPQEQVQFLCEQIDHQGQV
jgi:DNA-directed RNA polymerase specialized sigma24 family protein